MITLDRKSLKLQRDTIKWNYVFYHVGKFLSTRKQFNYRFQIPSKPIPLFKETLTEANGIFVFL